MSITFSSCFYIMKSKFDPNISVSWANNFLSIVNNFNLIIYTDEESYKYIPSIYTNNSRIQVIIKPFQNFYNYKYKDYWIKNHEVNHLLNDKIDWKVNMLWSEKIWFVKETIERKYFDTDFYGWCDIGYFRNRIEDTNTQFLKDWPNINIINKLDPNKICYACINNDNQYMNYLYKIINNKQENGLPIQPIPAHQNSVAGGFFILHKDKIQWWSAAYENKLKLYFENNYLVKDDQIILIDCILSDQTQFNLFREGNHKYDNWFMFQRLLL